MSISKEIERLQQAKKEIGDAIVRKGGSVSGTIDTYAKSVMALGDVSFRTAIDIVNKSDAKNVDLTMISPKNETNLDNLFRGNKILTNIDVSSWDTSSITRINAIFYKCTSLTNLDLSNWDMSNVKSAASTFNTCTSLTNLDISNWDMSNVTGIDWIFAFDNALSVIKCDGLRLPNIEMNNITLISNSLTVDSIVGLLNELPQSDKGYSFQIGSNNISKLSDEQKAIATNKGWTLI